MAGNVAPRREIPSARPAEMCRGPEIPTAGGFPKVGKGPADHRWMALCLLKRIVKRLPGSGWAYRLIQGTGLITPPALRKFGHREYVGGLWERLGKLQFDFLVKEGLRPEHYLLDIGCGSLRGGVHFIPYLEAAHYLGIDREASLIQAGLQTELSRGLQEAKRPRLLVSSAFEFERFQVRPHFALAQSLFTHLPAALIEDCLRKLRPVMAGDGRFYATYFETDVPASNPSEPQDRRPFAAAEGVPEPRDWRAFAYTRSEMEDLGRRNGWRPEYIGDWSHPRRQVMVRYLPD
jgi:hypothetical protein